MNLSRAFVRFSLAAAMLASPFTLTAMPVPALAATSQAAAPGVQNIGIISVLVHRKDKKGKKVLAVGSRVNVLDANNNIIRTGLTNNAGRITFSQLPVKHPGGSKYNLEAHWEGKLDKANTTLTVNNANKEVGMYIIR